MRAFQLETFDAPPQMRDIPEPRPDTNQVQVQIMACGLNFADLLMIRGTYQERPALPFTLGMELAGVVTALGSGTSTLTLGQRVAVFATMGGLAEMGCFPADACTPHPG